MQERQHLRALACRACQHKDLGDNYEIHGLHTLTENLYLFRTLDMAQHQNRCFSAHMPLHLATGM